MEILLLELTVLIVKKIKLEKKLRQTFKCLLRKCFTCFGMKNISNELMYLNESINELKSRLDYTHQRRLSLVTSV